MVTPNLAFDTAGLIQVVPSLLTPQTWFLDRYFPGMVMSDTEFLAIDVIIGKRRMAPFVNPLIEGKMVEALRVQTNIFKPPYIKDKRVPDLRRPIRRAVGERLGGGEMTGAEREQANIQFEMEDQLQMIQRRLEWMAIQELRSGTVVVAGDGFPTTTIDFGRPSNQTVVLSGGARWGQAGVSPAASLITWSQLILKASGATPTDVIMTPDAFALFLADPLVVGSVFYPTLSGFGNAINPGGQMQKGAINKGMWGQFNIFVYQDWYVDDNNVEQPMLPAYTVIMASPQELMGTRAFAQILDPEFNYQAMPYAPKTWITQDPAQRLIMMQSAPLPIPGRPSASLGATVN